MKKTQTPKYVCAHCGGPQQDFKPTQQKEDVVFAARLMECGRCGRDKFWESDRKKRR